MPLRNRFKRRDSMEPVYGLPSQLIVGSFEYPQTNASEELFAMARSLPNRPVRELSTAKSHQGETSGHVRKVLVVSLTLAITSGVVLWWAYFA
jgi:hypothetical protein